MMVARRDGAAMFPDLALERYGLDVGFLDHACKFAREHAGLAGGVDRDRCRSAAGGGLDGCRQLNDRPGQRSRDQKGQPRCAQYGDQSRL